jgi:hypothetical protein
MDEVMMELNIIVHHKQNFILILVESILQKHLMLILITPKYLIQNYVMDEMMMELILFNTENSNHYEINIEKWKL